MWSKVWEYRLNEQVPRAKTKETSRGRRILSHRKHFLLLKLRVAVVMDGINHRDKFVYPVGDNH